MVAVANAQYNRRRALLTISGMVLSSLLFLFGILAGTANARSGANAWVEDVRGTNYVGIVHRELAAATGSVAVAMFEMRVPQDAAESSPVVLLVSDLIAAHRRGVDVKVVLDLRSSYDPESGNAVRDYANGIAADMLTYAGIDVSYFPSSYHMHQKLVVIDEETVIIGSHNWTYSGLFKNVESSSLIRSREHARTKLTRINELKTFSAARSVAPDVTNTIPVPRDFLLRDELAPHMLTKNDKRPFEIYLLLLRYASESGAPTLSIDPLKVATELAIAPDDDKWVKRKYVIKAIRTLAERYALIDVTFHRGKDADVTILKNTSLTSAGSIQVPLAYWTYGLATELTQDEKFAYLICLNEEAQSYTPPLWRKSQEDLAKIYSVSRKPINVGLNGLQRHDILSILRSPIPKENFKRRRPNQYRLKPLLSPAERTARWQKLEQKHSPQLIAQARALATMVAYGNDFDSADQLAAAISAYGYETVSNTTVHVATKSVTNPNRHPDTIIDYLDISRRTR